MPGRPSMPSRPTVRFTHPHSHRTMAIRTASLASALLSFVIDSPSIQSPARSRTTTGPDRGRKPLLESVAGRACPDVVKSLDRRLRLVVAAAHHEPSETSSATASGGSCLSISSMRSRRGHCSTSNDAKRLSISLTRSPMPFKWRTTETYSSM